MKTLLYLFTFALVCSSCSPDVYEPMGARSESPYVKLKDGPQINAQEVYYTAPFIGTGRVVAGDTKFKGSKVAAFSDGEFTYANLSRHRRPAFAQKITSGDINMYRYTQPFFAVRFRPLVPSNIGGNSHYNSSVHDFIQLGDTGAIKTLTYRHLRPMIPPGSAGDKYLKNYHNAKIPGAALAVAGFSVALAGAMVIILDQGQHKQVNMGATAVLIGLPVGIIGGAMHSFGDRKLYKALRAHNTRLRNLEE